MSAVSIRIANAAGFLGDNKMAPRRLLESTDVDFLTLEHLAELTLSILAHQKQKDPTKGYAADLVDIVADVMPLLKEHQQVRIVSNGGGMNPRSCVREMTRHFLDAGLDRYPLAVVEGDDLLPCLDKLRNEGHELAHFDTGESLDTLQRPIVSANVYMGSAGIVQALDGGALTVVTGRVADAALTIAPALKHFAWQADDWPALAGAGVAGLIIECGAQATGGYCVEWQPGDLADVGYPIAEVSSNGDCVITKPRGSGGRVDRRSVTEQLVYEIGDPTAYLTPDVSIDFTSVELSEVGDNRIKINDAQGGPPPDTLKVSLAYHDGFTASGQLLVYGQDCIPKAREVADIVFRRVALAGFDLDRTHVELLGANEAIPGEEAAGAVRELVLRMAVHDQRRAAVQCFCEQIAPLITSGPAGLAGYASGRPRVRPMYAYWPATIPRDCVAPQVEVRTALEWAKGDEA